MGASRLTARPADVEHEERTVGSGCREENANEDDEDEEHEERTLRSGCRGGGDADESGAARWSGTLRRSAGETALLCFALRAEGDGRGVVRSGEAREAERAVAAGGRCEMLSGAAREAAWRAVIGIGVCRALSEISIS